MIALWRLCHFMAFYMLSHKCLLDILPTDLAQTVDSSVGSVFLLLLSLHQEPSFLILRSYGTPFVVFSKSVDIPIEMYFLATLWGPIQ